VFDVLIDSVATVAAAGGDGEGGSTILRFLGRLHPLVIHFPIALTIVAAVVELCNIIRRKATASEFAYAATGFAAVFAVVAAFFGWFMADYEGAGPKTALFLHRWLGVISAGALVIVFFCGMAGRTGRRISALNGYRWGLLLCAILVTVGAHFGAEMVWGKGYFTKVLFGSNPVDPIIDPIIDPIAGPIAGPIVEPSGEPDEFTTTVLPIFQARCVECHGPDKHKADLRLDSAAAIFAGDKKYWVITPGDAAASILIERVSYPIENPDVMPPKGETLTEEQITAITKWINDGAPYAKLDAGPAKPTPKPEPKPTPEPPVEDSAFDNAVTALRDRGVLVMPIAQDSEFWEVNASFANPPFDDAAISLMSGMEEALASANLARTKVGDGGMAGLVGFGNITNLRLDNTGVGDGGMEPLLALTKIETLNLYGTQVSDQGIETIVQLPNLKKLYCAGSKTTAEGVKAVQAKYPMVEIFGPDAPEAPAAPATEEPKPAE